MKLGTGRLQRLRPHNNTTIRISGVLAITAEVPLCTLHNPMALDKRKQKEQG